MEEESPANGDQRSKASVEQKVADTKREVLPDAGVAYGRIDGFAIFEFGCEAHGDGSPREITTTGDLQFLTSRERSSIDMFEDILADAFVVFGPTGVGKRHEVVEGKIGILCVVFGSIVGTAGTPGRAVAIDQLTKSSVVGGFLLCACTDERSKSANKSQNNIENPMVTWRNRTRLLTWSNGHLHLKHEIARGPLEGRLSFCGPTLTSFSPESNRRPSVLAGDRIAFADEAALLADFSV